MAAGYFNDKRSYRRYLFTLLVIRNQNSSSYPSYVFGEHGALSLSIFVKEICSVRSIQPPLSCSAKACLVFVFQEKAKRN